MKNIILCLGFCAFLTPLSMSAQIPETGVSTPTSYIAGGAGFIKTANNPNLIAKLETIDQRYSGSFAWDTIAQILYKYDRTLALGTRWVAAIPTTDNFWKLTGNSGTTAGTNFIGTTDNVDLVFKTNNAEKLRLTGYGLQLTAQSNTASYLNFYRPGYVNWFMGTQSNSYAFNISGSSDLSNALLTLHQSYNVGISQPTPQYKLDVNGNASATRLRFTQVIEHSNPWGMGLLPSEVPMLVRDNSTGFINKVNLAPWVAWNYGNNRVDTTGNGLVLGNYNNKDLTFITNNTTRATITAAGDMILNNKLNLVSQVYHPMTAADWGWSNILMRNQNTGNVETTTTYDIVKNAGLLQTDTVLAWPSRNVTLPNTAHNVFINGRIGNQYSTDSIVFMLPPNPVNGAEINFYVQKNAKLWVMDIILDGGNFFSSAPVVAFDEGNGLATNFAAPKQRKCLEFGVSANNPNYTGDLLPYNTAKAFKIACTYNELDRLWTVTSSFNQ